MTPSPSGRLFLFPFFCHSRIVKKGKEKPKLLIIAGPTASGKSDLAVQLAKEFAGEIISADSRQVYRGMDIGTGKVTRKEMAGIPHYLLDVANPQSIFSVAKFKKLAEKKIREIEETGKLPIICGGTGFYIDVMTQNLSLPEVKPNLKLRKELAQKDLNELSEKLKKLDRKRWQEIDKHNPHRLIRAIEIATAIGKVPPVKKTPAKFDLLEIGLQPDPETLKEKIHLRLLKRLKAGMVAEVRKLHHSGVSWKRLESFGLEYKWLAYFLQKKVTKTEMIEGLEKDINHYAKRQLTWFKRNKNIRWIKDSADARELVKDWLNT